MKSLTIKPNATVLLSFYSSEERDNALSALSKVSPPEVHRRFRSGEGDGVATLTIRLQDISQPLTLELDNVQPQTEAKPRARFPIFDKLKRLEEIKLSGEAPTGGASGEAGATAVGSPESQGFKMGLSPSVMSVTSADIL